VPQASSAIPTLHPTFLRSYIRSLPARDFAAREIVLAWARATGRVCDRSRQRFGVASIAWRAGGSSLTPAEHSGQHTFDGPHANLLLEASQTSRLRLGAPARFSSAAKSSGWQRRYKRLAKGLLEVSIGARCLRHIRPPAALRKWLV